MMRIWQRLVSPALLPCLPIQNTTIMHSALPLLHQYFERSAERFPRQIALSIPGPTDSPEDRREFSFEELDFRANALAAELRKNASGKPTIAITIGRENSNAYVAMLAVLKAGAAYTYLDPAFPRERQAQIVTDAGISTILCERETPCESFPGANLLPWDSWPDRPRAYQIPSPVASCDLAYIIYTSGTTGKPKGVLIEHSSICNLIESDIHAFGLSGADRIAQGSSLAYDSSVEEIWMAWSVGARVVVMDDRAARLGPDLVPWLRRQMVSVICPTPTLLRTMGCEDPEHELPDLHLIYAGGEAMTSDLVDKWSKTKWLENGYGPTECTVTVVRGRLQPGGPITIGKAVAGNETLILGSDGELVTDGQKGELCIRGQGLARGYHDLPEFTAQKFEQHPELGRIYHTGDWVRRDQDSNLVFLGRMDSQVKLRGYRIELQEIEVRLQGFDGVLESACTILGQGTSAVLVALAVGSGGQAASPNILDRLRDQIPGHMVPSRLFWVDRLPTDVSGKLDRKALETEALELQCPGLEISDSATLRGSSELETSLLSAMGKVLPPGPPPAPRSDFFLDLGGDSLAAATLISDLRKQSETAALTVRDIYELRTAQALAERLQETSRAGGAPQARPSGPDLPPASSLDPTKAAALQTLCIATATVFALAGICFVVFWALPKTLLHFGLWPMIFTLALIGPILPWLWIPPSVGFTWIAKRVLIGAYQPGSIPAWSDLYVRHWLLQRISALVPWGYLQGTVWHASVLRLLGAKVGEHVHLHRGVSFPLGGWDLLEIGDHVTLCQDAGVRPVEWHAGHLVLDRISIGQGCTVGVRAGLSPGATMESGSALADHAWLPKDGRAGKSELWDGIPSKAVGRAPAKPATQGKELDPVPHALCYMLARSCLSCALFLPWIFGLGLFLWIGDWSAQDVVAWLYGTHLKDWKTWAVLATLMVPLSLAIRALATRCMGRVDPGTYPLRSWPTIRSWIKAEQVSRAGLWISGSLFWPVWLRAAGMKIGRNSEISTIIDCVPEQVQIGEETFLADGIYLAPPKLHQGTCTIARTTVAERTFVGNHSVIPSGSQLADDILLGVCTVADVSKMVEGTSWFGNPSFELPKRQVVEIDRKLTHNPGPLRFVHRIFWEGSRALLPVLPTVLALTWFQWCSHAIESHG
ncbi:MAG: amino acid adenylation domain-containing protein, partial [bacterium]|nr:amino acid adenylation domain-containing protein [bacterium]